MAIKIKREIPTRNVVPEGEYAAIIDSISVREGMFKDRGGEAKSYLLFVFRIIDPAELIGRTVGGPCPSVLTPGNKLDLWLKAAGVNTLEISDTLNEDAILKKLVRVYVEHKTRIDKEGNAVIKDCVTKVKPARPSDIDLYKKALPILNEYEERQAQRAADLRKANPVEVPGTGVVQPTAVNQGIATGYNMVMATANPTPSVVQPVAPGRVGVASTQPEQQGRPNKGIDQPIVVGTPDGVSISSPLTPQKPSIAKQVQDPNMPQYPKTVSPEPIVTKDEIVW